MQLWLFHLRSGKNDMKIYSLIYAHNITNNLRMLLFLKI